MKKRRKFLKILIATILASVINGCAGQNGALDPEAILFPIFNDERQQLTSEYSRVHYGDYSFKLNDPQLIVVHYTAIPNLNDTLDFFLPVHLDRQFRKDIASGGDVNVSTHYVVDKDGKLYQLAPENVMCRHIIGFNYTAIGIENVAAGVDDLTEEQASTTAELVRRIVMRHPTVKFLIGHHEYRDSGSRHFQLLRELDLSYKFTDKIDPGILFMEKVRSLLQDKYGLVFQR